MSQAAYSHKSVGMKYKILQKALHIFEIKQVSLTALLAGKLCILLLCRIDFSATSFSKVCVKISKLQRDVHETKTH